MGNWFGLPLLVLAAALQVTFVQQIRLLGGEPNLILLLVLSYAVRAPFDQGVVWALVGGILLDLVTALPTGSSVLGLLLVVILVELVRRQVTRIGFVALIGLVIAGSLTMQATALFIALAQGYNVRLGDVVTDVMLPSVAYNLVVIWPVYWFVRRFCPPPIPLA